MSERDGYEAGVPCWVDTWPPEPRNALSFYGNLFGWEFTHPDAGPGEADGEYFVAQSRGRDVAGIGSQPSDGASPVSAWSTYIWVRSADETAERARLAGGGVVAEPSDAPLGGRMAVLADPAGASFCAWEASGRHGAQLVNEPGAWSMSQLNTHDPERSKDFYGAVFGWTTETFDLGDSEIALFRLPGYVGGEPQQPVSREVVAVMVLASGDALTGDPLPHWSVDFWVDDVDATAARAAKLGGKVVAAPFDIAIGRTAVLADPQGGAFSVSKVATRG